MALPWLAVGKLVLNNLDTIIGVVKPAFTRKKVDAEHMDLLNQQIAELQAAASSNAEQIKQPRIGPFHLNLCGVCRAGASGAHLV